MEMTPMAGSQNIVIIGGVAAGMKTACRLRRLDPSANITVVEKGKHLSYAGCGLPYYVEGLVETLDGLKDTPAGTVRNAAFFRAVKDVEVRTQMLAERVDRDAKCVHVKDLKRGRTDTLPYDKLVIATGARPFMPPIDGLDLDRVYRLYDPDEADVLRRAVEARDIKRAVLIGGGLIGMETAEALTVRGVEVTIVEMMDHVLPALLDLEPAAFLTKHLRAKGVTVLTGGQVKSIEDNGQGKVGAVVAGDQRVETDMVLMAIGVRPNVDLAKDAGLDLGPTGAIAVDDHCLTSDPDIYAGGDCVESMCRVTGKSIYVPLGSTANKHGRVIADNLAGRDTQFDGVVRSCVFKAFDFSIARTGLTERQARDAGYDVRMALTPGPDRAHYYPTSLPILVKLIADADTDKILGGQVVGPGECVKRVDILATAIYHGATIDDVASYDLCYAPPYSAPVDNIAVAANVIRNKRDGLARSIPPQDVYAKMQNGDDFILLDVRTPAEIEQMRIDDPRVTCIGLGALRDRAVDLPRDKEIIAFCKISLRGYEAQLILESAGFRDVKFMDGGVVGWPYGLKTGGN
jgi:NADPH-dependent 2,4-dienoyl-CoA reductase/sulfur reductase-like enzyme/rhodanese-related sulfurtransferase